MLFLLHGINLIWMVFPFKLQFRLKDLNTQQQQHQCPQSRTSYPLAKVAGEDEVSGEGVGEGRVKLQHLEQGFPLDDMEVAVR